MLHILIESSPVESNYLVITLDVLPEKNTAAMFRAGHRYNRQTSL